MIGRVDEGSEIPWWAGVAWFDCMRREVVYAPTGIAKLIGASRWAYHALRAPIRAHEHEKAVALLNRLQKDHRKAIKRVYELTETGLVLRPLLEFLASMKSREVWGDDGQSWTIDVASCEGKPEEIIKLMLRVKRGEYTGETE